jgi:hypothetical protein
MPEFNEWKGDATRWTRFDQVVISNPIGSSPYVTCRAQDVIELVGGEKIIRNTSQLNFAFDPAYTFPILDPSNNQPTGQTASMGEVYALVYSAVLAQAAQGGNNA